MTSSLLNNICKININLNLFCCTVFTYLPNQGVLMLMCSLCSGQNNGNSGDTINSQCYLTLRQLLSSI